MGIIQNYLVYIPAIKYIKYFSGTTRIESWKADRMSEESIEKITKADSDFPPNVVDHFLDHLLVDMNFNEHCFIKNNVFIPKK